ncbi:superoxide dismutase [Fe] [Bacteroidales bacterium OttesenSCG-928-C19]|nr:superoxide dismutase [Fe] [Bacteroidales bacterium OttesenSCG-928-C19]
MFQLPALPYKEHELEPHISKETIEYHYGKHHQTYVNNLNNLIQGTDLENAKLEDIIKKTEGGVFNNAAQVWNHTFYWNCLSPNGGGQPKGALRDAIIRDFESFDLFKDKFTKAAVSLFGSGWTWLVKTAEGKLEIIQTSNAGCPLTANQKPILTCDVWEHAYYIDKRNARAAYVDEFWKIVNWDFAESQFR